jgi:uncharacterized protein
VASGAPARIVLDTNCWLDLLWFRDPRCAALAAAIDEGCAVAVTNAACRDEWLRVLDYPQLAIAAPDRAALAARYDATTRPIDDARTPVALPRCRDPDDQKFLVLAHGAGALALFTRDARLLALAGRCRRMGGFEILEPREAASILA